MTPADLVTYRRKEVGFVWQQTSRNVVPYLTALQNVELPMILEGVEPGPARNRARELLEMVGLGHRLDVQAGPPLRRRAAARRDRRRAGQRPAAAPGRRADG